MVLLVASAAVGCTRRDLDPGGRGVGGTAPSPPAVAPGSASPGIASPGPSPQAGTFTVNMMDDLRYSPTSLRVPRGSTVTWRNAGQAPHTVTSTPRPGSEKAKPNVPQGAEPWDSGPLGAGQTFSRTFDQPGDYQYYCTFHEQQGMVATISVFQP